jgi:type I restriction enzyme, S subunit
MRKGWEVKRLCEICIKITDGSHAPPKGIPISEYSMLSSKNVFNDAINYDNPRYLAQTDFTIENNRTQVTSGDVLLTIVGTIGRVAVVPNNHHPFTLQRSVAVLKIDKSKITSRFLMFSLQNKFDALTNEARGVAQKGIYLNQLNNFTIPIPPLTEQKHIVATLDEAFTAIAKAKENTEMNLQNAKELFESELNSVFENKGVGWEEKRLDEIAATFGRGKSKHRPRNDKKLYGGKYPFIQTGDVRNADKFITQYSQTYNEVGLAQSKLWHKGTICITIAANIAETGILSFDSCFPDSMIGLVVDPKKADANFTYYALQFLKGALQLLGKGSAQDNINMGTFKTQTFPFPKLEIQKKIAYQLDTLSAETKKLEAIYHQKLNALEELKKSILEKAFKGELKTEKALIEA